MPSYSPAYGPTHTQRLTRDEVICHAADDPLLAVDQVQHEAARQSRSGKTELLSISALVRF